MSKRLSKFGLNTEIVTICVALSWVISGCYINTYGKFQPDEGIPKFINRGETTRKEVFDKLGEPTVYRHVVDTETAIYSHVHEEYFFLYGTYLGRELVIRFVNNVVSDVRIEKTGSGWGCLMPAYQDAARFFNSDRGSSQQ